MFQPHASRAPAVALPPGAPPNNPSVTAIAEARRTWMAYDRAFHVQADSVSLVAELMLPASDLAEMVNALTVIGTQPPAATKADVKHGATALAVLMPNVCREDYGEATFWPHFWDRIGVPQPRRQALQTAFGETFLEGLKRARWPAFDDVGQKYLANILMHAGVPDALLPDWFELLDAATRAVTLEPDLVTRWIRDRAGVGGLPWVNVPLRRLVLHGGPFAADLIERSLTLLDLVRSGSDRDPAFLGLPPAYLTAAETHCRARAALRATGGIRAASAPVLRLVPEEGRVELALPQLEDVVDTLRWLVKIEQRTVEIVPHRLWGGDRVQFAGATVPVDTPTRSIEVRAIGADRAALVPVVPDDLPLLAFDRSGAAIRVAEGLPAEPVWLLGPPSGSAAGPQLSVVGGRLMADMGSPLGWAGWPLSLWDLGGAEAVEVGDHTVGLTRRTRAQIESAPAGHVEAASIAGLPLHTQRPAVSLPAGHAQWSVTVSDYQTGQIVTELRHQGEAMSLDPFAGMPAPIVGAFTIVVRGPLGRGASRTFALAEGLSVKVEPHFRTFGPDGLRPARAAIALPGGTTSSAVVEFAAAERLSSVLVTGAEGRQERIVIQPPSLAVAIQAEGQPPGAWSNGPITVLKEDLVHTHLLLRIGLGAQPELAVCSGNSAVQTLDPISVTAERNVAYKLARIVDSVDHLGANGLVLGRTSDDPGVLVARIVPRKLATGIAVDDPGLRLVDPGSGDLEVALWSTGEPWRPPIVRRCDQDGRIALLPGDVLSGRVVAVPRVSDPWSLPDPFPRFPYRFSMLVSDPMSAEEESTIAPADTSVERAWATVLLNVVLPGSVQASGLADARQALDAHGPEALAALSTFALPPTESAAALVRTGVAGACSNVAGDDLSIAESLRADPVAASLAHLPTVMARPDDFPEARLAVRDALGDAGLAFLDTGVDDHMAAGAYGDDPSLIALARLRKADVARFETLLASMALRPVGLLHPDNRVLRSVEILERVGAERVRILAKDSLKLVVTVRASLAKSGFDRAAHAIEERGVSDGTPWLNLSAASLAWCIALRYGARGHELERLSPHPQMSSWRENAHAIAPLQAVDLVLAEIHASHDLPINDGRRR